MTVNQSEDRKRAVVTQAAGGVSSFSGVCNLKTDDGSDFNDCYVEVKGDMQRLLLDAKFKLLTNDSFLRHHSYDPRTADGFITPLL